MVRERYERDRMNEHPPQDSSDSRPRGDEDAVPNSSCAEQATRADAMASTHAADEDQRQRSLELLRGLASPNAHPKNATQPESVHDHAAESATFQLMPHAMPHADLGDPRSKPPPELPLSSRLPLRLVRQGQQHERHFSLTSLLILVTLSALVFTAGRYLSPAGFAGLVGLAMLVYMGVVSFFELRDSFFTLGMWLLLGIYLLAVTIAIFHA